VLTTGAAVEMHKSNRALRRAISLRMERLRERIADFDEDQSELIKHLDTLYGDQDKRLTTVARLMQIIELITKQAARIGKQRGRMPGDMADRCGMRTYALHPLRRSKARIA
jgi:hypothetical protein